MTLAFDGSDVRGFCNQVWAARRENRHREAMDSVERALAIRPDEPSIRDVGAMLFYDLEVKPLPIDADLATCERLFQRSQQFRPPPSVTAGNFGIYSYRLVALKLSKLVVQEKPRLAIQILETLAVNELSSERRKMEQARGPRTILLSDRDTYFLRLTKAYELTQRWTDLLELEQAAIGALADSEHQHWVLMRLVKAALEVANVETAMRLCGHSSVKEDNPHWRALLARVMEAQGDSSSAIELLRAVIGAQKDLSFQVKNLALLADLMIAVDRVIADSLTKLEFEIRSGNGWSIRDDLRQRLSQVKTPDTEIWPEKRLREWLRASSKTTVKSREKKGDGVRHFGRVKNHSGNGFSGFISKEGGGDIYFALRPGAQGSLPKVGTRVSFFIEPSFDKKKNRESERAVDVKVVADRPESPRPRVADIPRPPRPIPRPIEDNSDDPF